MVRANPCDLAARCRHAGTHNLPTSHDAGLEVFGANHPVPAYSRRPVERLRRSSVDVGVQSPESTPPLRYHLHGSCLTLTATTCEKIVVSVFLALYTAC